MKLSEFDFELPEELIAQHPVEKRDTSRLMVVNRENGNIEHRHFYDILDYLKPGDVLVRNNTKVIPARLFGIKEETNGHVEVLLLKELKKEMNTAVVIKMKQTDKKNLSARAGKIIGKRPIYDFSVTGIKKKQSSVLKKGRIRVAVSYNASKKEKDKKIFAYKIDKYSAAVKIPGSYYDSDTKTVNFVSRGFFTVAVGCEKWWNIKNHRSR